MFSVICSECGNIIGIAGVTPEGSHVCNKCGAHLYIYKDANGNTRVRLIETKNDNQ